MTKKWIKTSYDGESFNDFESTVSWVISNGDFDVQKLPSFESIIWVQTSGSGGKVKWVALTKDGMLKSARLFNDFFKITYADSWIHLLPVFHVGGFCIFARAFLLDQRIFVGLNHGKWDPTFFVDRLMETKASLCSMVPTQLYDLCRLNLVPPSSLRYVFVGGSKLDGELLHKATELGWPVVNSYGMTETSAMIAASKNPHIQTLTLFPNWTVENDELGKLKIKGPGLLQGYWNGQDYIDPKVDGHFITEDFGSLRDGVLHLEGRSDDLVKIYGEKVSKLELADKFKKFFNLTNDVYCLSMPDERKGLALYMVIEGVSLDLELERFNAEVEGPQRLSGFFFIDSFPRTSLGKLKYGELTEMVLKREKISPRHSTD